MLICYPVPADQRPRQPGARPCSTRSCRRARARGSTRASSIATSSPQTAETFSTPSRAPGNLGVLSRSWPAARPSTTGEAALRARDRAAARRAGHRRRTGRGQEPDPHRRAARPRDRRGQGRDARRVGDHRRRSPRRRSPARRDRRGHRRRRPARRAQISARRAFGDDPLPARRKRARPARRATPIAVASTVRGRAARRAARCRDRHARASEAERIAPPAPGAPVVAAIPDAERDPARQRPARDRGRDATNCRCSPPRWSPPAAARPIPPTRAGARQPHRRPDDQGHDDALRHRRSRSRSRRSAARSPATPSWDGSTDVDDGQVRPGRARRSPSSPMSRSNPAFAADEIERARAQAIDGVTVDAQGSRRSSPGWSPARTVFGDAPYGHRAVGHPDIAQGDHARRHPQRLSHGPGAPIRRR